MTNGVNLKTFRSLPPVLMCFQSKEIKILKRKIKNKKLARSVNFLHTTEFILKEIQLEKPVIVLIYTQKCKAPNLKNFLVCVHQLQPSFVLELSN